MAKPVKPKKRCCRDKPRCKRCPLVLARLERQGLAKRDSRGRYVVKKNVKKKRLAAARAR